MFEELRKPHLYPPLEQCGSNTLIYLHYVINVVSKLPWVMTVTHVALYGWRLEPGLSITRATRARPHHCCNSIFNSINTLLQNDYIQN